MLLLLKFDDDHHVAEVGLNLHLYLRLLSLFLTNKCAVFLQVWSVIQYDPKLFANSEIQKLNVFFGPVTEGKNLY